MIQALSASHPPILSFLAFLPSPLPLRRHSSVLMLASIVVSATDVLSMSIMSAVELDAASAVELDAALVVEFGAPGTCVNSPTISQQIY